jgi:hypothetical protein
MKGSITPNPYQRAEAWHRRLGCHMTFAEVIEAHGQMGYVHITPDVFVMARRVEADWGDDRLCDLQFIAPAGDCWHVWLLAGDFRAAMAFLPYPLPYVSFHRRGRLRVMPLDRALRLTNSR